jgi:transaldolase/glucose-6-phosphate isomerase
MIKVPGTKPGVPAIRALIGGGINVNVTLLFGIDAYLAVADAHMAGLEAFRAGGGDVSKVHGVASFFVSRIDGMIDKKIDERLATALGDEAETLACLRGKVAIANAKLAYEVYQEVFKSDRFKKLEAAGARVQRCLWASTSTKNPDYPDALYVEELIGPDTVNTLPRNTLEAYANHGDPAPRLEQGVDEARALMNQLDEVGIDMQQVTDELIDEGVKAFADAFDKLLDEISKKAEKVKTGS